MGGAPMKNTFGTSVAVTLFGESHGEAVGAVVDGLCPGLSVDEAAIRSALSRRRPTGDETARREPDDFRIVSGVFNGRTTGTPLCLLIPNTDTDSGAYSYGEARPSHADYAAYCKYHGFEDYRGGGHFSGRLTAPLVAAGAIAEQALGGLGITLATHILRCGGASDREFSDVTADIALLKKSDFPVLGSDSREAVLRELRHAADAGDSVGGVTQTAIVGLPAGVGEPWFDSAESLLSHAMFSIGGIKGVDFGAGFEGVCTCGSQFNDAFRMDGDTVITNTNRNGGINGGITNGMPVVFRCAVKPTPSIAAMQQSVDFIRKKNIDITVRGRHDPAILRRICPVIDSLTALTLCDLLAQRYGTDVFAKGIV